MNALAITHQWLDTNLPMPSDEEIAKLWNPKKTIKAHPLDIHREQIKEWHAQGLSSVVIQQLLKDDCSCSEQAIRRYRTKYFQSL